MGGVPGMSVYGYNSCLVGRCLVEWGLVYCWEGIYGA